MDSTRMHMHICNICGAVGGSAYAAAQHVRTHMTLKPTSKLIDDGPITTFFYSLSIESDPSRYGDDDPDIQGKHVCDLCGQAYDDEQAAIDHVIGHIQLDTTRYDGWGGETRHGICLKESYPDE